jgi:PadR family transcriptional regulator PadR
MKVDKISGNTTMLILELLINGDMYGYQMIDELERRSQNIFTLKAGTLYPLLHTLEQQGMIESYDMETDKGKTRKYYHIKKEGKKLLEKKKIEWGAYSSAINLVLRRTQLCQQPTSI